MSGMCSDKERSIMFSSSSYRSYRSRRFHAPARAVSLAMALIAIIGTRPARSSPGDVFAIGAPTASATPAKAADIQDGDASVSTQTGALDYSYPIPVPPGRHGMQPRLALAYSSQAATHGGVAAGWSLSIPSITEDTSQGRLWATVISVPVKNYVSSMAGGRPLLIVTEPAPSDVAAAYRAQNDASFVRYQQMRPGTGYPWRALTSDGTTFYFGEADHVGNCTTVSDGLPR